LANSTLEREKGRRREGGREGEGWKEQLQSEQGSLTMTGASPVLSPSRGLRSAVGPPSSSRCSEEEEKSVEVVAKLEETQ
jgi:hypothetical protein